MLIVFLVFFFKRPFSYHIVDVCIPIVNVCLAL